MKTDPPLNLSKFPRTDRKPAAILCTQALQTKDDFFTLFFSDFFSAVASHNKQVIYLSKSPGDVLLDAVVSHLLRTPVSPEESLPTHGLHLFLPSLWRPLHHQTVWIPHLHLPFSLPPPTAPRCPHPLVRPLARSLELHLFSRIDPYDVYCCLAPPKR